MQNMYTPAIIASPSKKDIGIRLKSREYKTVLLRSHISKWGDQYAMIVGFDKKKQEYAIKVDGKIHTIKCDKLWVDWVIR